MIRLPNIRLGIAMLLSIGLATFASAEEAKGTIASVNAASAQVVIKGVVSNTIYDLSKDARVCLDGGKAKLGDLRDGDQAVIEYKKSGNQMIASEVRALRKASETTGTVRNVNSENSQLVLKGVVKDTTYHLEKNATVWINGKEGRLADLREGDQVRVTYESRGDQLMAAAVSLTKR